MTSVSEAGEGGAWASIESLPLFAPPGLSTGSPPGWGPQASPVTVLSPNTHTHRQTHAGFYGTWRFGGRVQRPHPHARDDAGEVVAVSQGAAQGLDGRA